MNMIADKPLQSAVVQSPFRSSSAVCYYFYGLPTFAANLGPIEEDAAKGVLRSFFTASSEGSRVDRLLHKETKFDL
jgi:hypothetical protein